MSNLLPVNSTVAEHNMADTIDNFFLNIPNDIKTLWNPKTCPVDLLPWLAWSYSVDTWNDTWSEEKKRSVIAASYSIHKTKGTVGATKRALESLGYDSKMIEWFDSGKDPYTFDVEVYITNESLSESVYTDIRKAINSAKNARSILDEVRVIGSLSTSLHIQGAVYSANTINIEGAL